MDRPRDPEESVLDTPLGQFRLADSHIPNVYFWTVGGRWRSWREPAQTQKQKHTSSTCSVANRFLSVGVKILVIQARSGGATPIGSMIRYAATFILGLQVLWDRSAHHLVPITATLLPSPTIWVSFIIALVAAVIFIEPVIPPLSPSPTHPSPLSSPASIMHTFLARS